MKYPLFDLTYIVVLFLFAVEILKLIQVFLQRKKVEEKTASSLPFISVIIPVRNEESRIKGCLSGITQQTYPKDKFEIIVVDDHSEDRTREIISSFIPQCPNLRVFAADPVPEGWGGKSHANHLASKKATGEFLIFMDADVFAKPEMLKQVMSHVIHHELDVASIVPQRILVSWQEKILLAPLFPIIGIAFDDKKVKLSGEFILFRRKVYDAIGGHAKIKSTVSDDLDFAALLEKTSFKTDFLFAEKLATTRMYLTFNDIYEGISKMYQRLLSENETVAIRRSAKYFLFAFFSILSAGLFYENFHPQLFSADVLLILPVALAAVFTVITFYLRINFLFGLLMPLGCLFQPILLYRSIRGKRKKYHVWRGRKVYHRTDPVSN